MVENKLNCNIIYNLKSFLKILRFIHPLKTFLFIVILIESCSIFDTSNTNDEHDIGNYPNGFIVNPMSFYLREKGLRVEINLVSDSSINFQELDTNIYLKFAKVTGTLIVLRDNLNSDKYSSEFKNLILLYEELHYTLYKSKLNKKTFYGVPNRIINGANDGFIDLLDFKYSEEFNSEFERWEKKEEINDSMTIINNELIKNKTELSKLKTSINNQIESTNKYIESVKLVNQKMQTDIDDLKKNINITEYEKILNNTKNNENRSNSLLFNRDGNVTEKRYIDNILRKGKDYYIPMFNKNLKEYNKNPIDGIVFRDLSANRIMNPDFFQKLEELVIEDRVALRDLGISEIGILGSYRSPMHQKVLKSDPSNKRPTGMFETQHGFGDGVDIELPDALRFGKVGNDGIKREKLKKLFEKHGIILIDHSRIGVIDDNHLNFAKSTPGNDKYDPQYALSRQIDILEGYKKAMLTEQNRQQVTNDALNKEKANTDITNNTLDDEIKQLNKTLAEKTKIKDNLENLQKDLIKEKDLTSKAIALLNAINNPNNDTERSLEWIKGYDREFYERQRNNVKNGKDIDWGDVKDRLYNNDIRDCINKGGKIIESRDDNHMQVGCRNDSRDNSHDDEPGLIRERLP